MLDSKFSSVNSILFRNYSVVHLPSSMYFGTAKDNAELNQFVLVGNINAKLLNAELSNLGYSMDADLYSTVKKLNPAGFVKLTSFLLSEIKNALGVNVNHRPLFKNFPNVDYSSIEYSSLNKEIYDAARVDLNRLSSIKNAKLLSCGCIVDVDTFKLENYNGCPLCGSAFGEYDLELSSSTRPASKQSKIVTAAKLKYIGVVEESVVFSFIESVFNSTTSISEQVSKDVTELFSIYKDEILATIKLNVSFKEHLALLYKLVTTYTSNDGRYLSKFINNATDILRIITALNGGDISLNANVKFKSMPRKQRRGFLQLLNSCKNPAEDMIRDRERWLRIGEVIHSREYALRFPVANSAFQMLRTGAKVETFNSTLDAYIKARNIRNLVQLLSTRPGEFLRRLDFVIRLIKNQTDFNYAVNMFNSAIGKMSTPTLLQVSNMLKYRVANKYSFIVPKGKVAKLKILDETREHLASNYVDTFCEAISSELRVRFKALPAMGKVYLDSELKNFILPFSQRSASSGTGVLTRGSRVDAGDNEVIRLFIYWKDQFGQNADRIDVDLSSVFYNEDWTRNDVVSFSSYGRTEFAKFSGDYTSAPNGASEFIDINKSAMMAAGYRYVVMNVNMFHGPKFSEMDECFGGYVDLKSFQPSDYDRNRNESLVDPQSVKMKMNLRGDGKFMIPFVYDAYTNQLIWMDFVAASRPADTASRHSNRSLFGKYALVTSEMNVSKPNAYDLLKLHVDTRGELVSTPEDADVVFDFDTLLSNLNTVSSEFMK